MTWIYPQIDHSWNTPDKSPIPCTFHSHSYITLLVLDLSHPHYLLLIVNSIVHHILIVEVVSVEVQQHSLHPVGHLQSTVLPLEQIDTIFDAAVDHQFVEYSTVVVLKELLPLFVIRFGYQLVDGVE